MSHTPDRTIVWVKSTYSGGEGGQCIEWAPTQAATTGSVPVRDSKDPEGPALFFSAGMWSRFIADLKSGRLSA